MFKEIKDKIENFRKIINQEKEISRNSRTKKYNIQFKKSQIAHKRKLK